VHGLLRIKPWLWRFVYLRCTAHGILQQAQGGAVWLFQAGSESTPTVVDNLHDTGYDVAVVHIERHRQVRLWRYWHDHHMGVHVHHQMSRLPSC
jgi:hypothetical protein